MGSDPVAKQEAEIIIPPTIAKALIKIQKTLKPMLKSAVNDLYGSGYVPLEDVADKAYELLANNGVGVSQPLSAMPDGSTAIETILFTGSGQGFKRKTKLVLGKNDPQGVLAALTYFRRGALMTTIGLTAKGEDDDGNKASGVQVPVTEEQIHEIKMLLSLMHWTREDIARAVFALKTKDAAQLAILRYRDLTSEKMRDEEAKVNATSIEVGDGNAPLDEVVDESSPLATLQAGITKLGLKNKMMEKQFIYSMTGRTSLDKVVEPADLKALANAIDAVASGKHPLPAEYYSNEGEHLVNEPVA